MKRNKPKLDLHFRNKTDLPLHVVALGMCLWPTSPHLPSSVSLKRIWSPDPRVIKRLFLLIRALSKAAAPCLAQRRHAEEGGDEEDGEQQHTWANFSWRKEDEDAFIDVDLSDRTPVTTAPVIVIIIMVVPPDPEESVWNPIQGQFFEFL